MELKVPYFNLRRGQAEAVYGALVEILLKSRMTLRLDAPRGFNDEDVNAYLAGVLVDYIDAAPPPQARPCVAARDTDVFWQATRADDASHAYWVYKVNADDRLIDLGIFHPPGHPPGPKADAVLAQARAYYGLASAFNHRVHRRDTAVSDIFVKLAEGAERYVSILNQARRDYLSFVETISDEAWNAWQQSLHHS